MLDAKRNYERTRADVPITIFKQGDRINVGPFEIEAVGVNHSIPEPMSLVIRTPLGNIVHTGDWKIDHAPSLGPLTDEARFRAIGDEGVLALMCDSTNAMRDGVSPQEEEVSASLTKIIENATGRVAFDRQGIRRRRSRSPSAWQFDEACLRRGARCRPYGRSEPVHRRRRIRLYPARQGRGDPDRQPG
jgi:hypothetical protein